MVFYKIKIYKQKVGNFLLPLVATRQVRQGGYLHKNIFDVQHLHQSQIICIIVVLKVLKYKKPSQSHFNFEFRLTVS